MNTWTFNRSIAPLCVCLGVSACTLGDGDFAFLAPKSAETTSKDEPRKNVALKSAEMARGAVQIVPPDGFCLDKREHSRDFTILARCDSLGGKGGAQDAVLGMITVSVAPVQGDWNAPELLTQLIPQSSDTLETRGDDVALAHLKGDVPNGASPTHWRGLTRIGGYAMSMVAYAPEGGSLSGEAGAQALKTLAMRSHDASLASAVVRKTGDTQKQQRKGLGGWLSGLLD